MHIFHKWETKKNKRTSVKRRCSICDRKEINVWDYWSKVQSERDLELYEML